MKLLDFRMRYRSSVPHRQNGQVCSHPIRQVIRNILKGVSDEENGHGKSRLDRLEEFTEILLQEHIAFAEEHKKLLIAQVVLNDQLQEIRDLQKATDARLAESYARLAESTRHTDERMNALIAVVDGLVRKQPPPQ